MASRTYKFSPVCVWLAKVPRWTCNWHSLVKGRAGLRRLWLACYIRLLVFRLTVNVTIEGSVTLQHRPNQSAARIYSSVSMIFLPSHLFYSWINNRCSKI